MTSFLYFLFLLSFGICLVIIIIKNKKNIEFLLPLFFVSLAFRAILIFLNENLNIFASKLASNRSLNIFLEWIGNQNFSFSIIDRPFFFQTLINTPGFYLFGPSRNNLLLTNAFIGAFTGIVVFAYLRHLFGQKIAKYGFILFSIYPAAINFSFSGLRDILIYFFIAINILSILGLSISNRRIGKIILNFSVFSLSFICIKSLRYEILPIIIFLPALLLLNKSQIIRKKIKNVNVKFIFTASVGVIIIVLICFSFFYVYNKATAKIGYKSLVSPKEIASNFAEARFKRPVEKEFGAGSHILAPQIYLKTNFLIRSALQTLGMIIIPFPWLITDLTMFLALFDSIFVIFCLFWTCKGVRSYFIEKIDRNIILFLLLNFFFAILAMGLVVSNAGNAFRMRLSIMPYLLIGTSIYLGKSKFLKKKSVL